MAMLKIVGLNDIGAEIGRIRKKAKGLSQVEVEGKTKMKVAKLSKIEHGKQKCKVDEIEKLADALGIKIAFIIAESEDDIRRLLEPDK